MTTPLYASVHACSRKHAHVRSTCMHVHVCTAVDRQEWVFFNSLSQLSTCQHPATVTWVVWHSINSPPHMRPYKPHLCSYDWGCGFSFSNSQSGLYSTIRNCLTPHSKPDLRWSVSFRGAWRRVELSLGIAKMSWIRVLDMPRAETNSVLQGSGLVRTVEPCAQWRVALGHKTKPIES